MTSGRWGKIAALFEAAAALSPDARGPFLDAECAGDARLRAEVEAMLAHDGADSRLADTVRDAVSGFDPEVLAASQTGFGPWRITGRLGSGGMGTVYKAVRADGAFQMEAAIKVLHMDSPVLVERFRQERQILARLDHPDIARLIDGGETAAGSPFLVMEFVDGEPLLDYAARRKLPREERLRLFLRICGAVQYLHRNLVVHRDLKPSNLLVTSGGSPKLLDFGIAKPLHEDAARTATGLLALTPQYASPEQVRGLPVTVASDVYSLGVILYELLSGRPPYEFHTLAPVEVDRVICEAPVPRPGIDPDLDNILLMALRKEPERRYATTGEFARDIERALSNQPVIARPDTFAYRASKFVRRHWLALAAAAVVAGSLAAGVIVTRREAARAQKRFVHARLFANGLLNDFYPKIQSLAGATEARATLVKSTLAYLGQLSTEAAGDPDLQLDLAVNFSKIGDLQSSSDTSNTGEYEAALKTYGEAIRLSEAALRGGADRKRALETLASAGIGTGEAAMYLERWDLALNALRRAKTAGEAIPDFRHIVSAYNREGDIYHWRGEIERALAIFRESEQIIGRFHAAPGHYLSTWHRFAQALWDLGRLDEARTVMLQSVRTADDYRKARPTSLYRVHLAINSHGQLAGLLGGRGVSHRDFAGALPHAHAAFTAAGEMIAKDAADVNSRLHLIEIAAWLAPVFAARDREGLGRLERQLATLPDSKPELAAARGFCLATLGRHREAFPHFESAVKQFGEPARTDSAAALVWTLLDWSDALRAVGRDGSAPLHEAKRLAGIWAGRVPAHAGLRFLRESAVPSRMAQMPIRH